MEPRRDSSDYSEASYEQDFASFDDPKDLAFILANSHQYREASEYMLGLLNNIVTFLFNHGYHKSPQLYGIAFAIGHPITIAQNMLDVARKTNVTKAAISKIAMDFLQATGLPPSAALKTELAKNIYKKTNGNKRNTRSDSQN
jgi:hypothetical protein